MMSVSSIGELLTQPLLNSDTYKHSHWTFEHPSFTSSYSYIEARKGGAFKEVMFFGLQYVLRYYLSQPVTMEMIDEAEAELTEHGVPFNRPEWEYIVETYGGYLPIRVCSLPEGIVVPHGTVLVTIESLDEKCAGLAAYVETLVQRGVWFPSTIATRSMRWFRLIERYLNDSGTPDLTGFKMVDFGARGVSSTESAGLGGMAHLVNFMVTDNLMGIRFARHAYDSPDMPGFSIPATEHSVTTSWGQENELAFFQRILDVHGNKPGIGGVGRYPVSVVIDTYDQDQALRMWGTTLKDKLINSNMQLVARPDSGDPIINVIHCLEVLDKYFGSQMNDKGYRVLPDAVRLIQGDGINEDSLRRILQRMTYHRWSVDNVAFGSGGGLLAADVTRDTHRFAQKTSSVIIGGRERETQKIVATDPSKASKKGRFAVVMPKYSAKLQTIAERDLDTGEANYLRPVFETGKLIKPLTFQQVRENAAQWRTGVEQ
jgi:nicotinamide phosphoribosyltransferase